MKISYFDTFNSQGFGTKIKSEFVDGDRTQLHIFINGDMESFFTRFFMNGMIALLDAEKDIGMIYLDFGAVNYVSSSFIANLLQIIHRAGQTGINVFFLNPNASLHAMIDAMGLAHFVKEIDVKSQKPIKIICRNCRRSLTVRQVGQITCPHCQTVLHVGEQGAVR